MIKVPIGILPHEKEIVKEILNEVVSARFKYPGNEGRFIAFASEAGEALSAFQKLQRNKDESQRKALTHELHRELVQVAAMALRLISESDPLV